MAKAFSDGHCMVQECGKSGYYYARDDTFWARLCLKHKRKFVKWAEKQKINYKVMSCREYKMGKNFK